MADAHVGVFNATKMRRIDDNELVHEIGHTATFCADEANGPKAILLRPIDRFDDVGRIAAHAHREDHVGRFAVAHQLADENVFVGVIVAEGGHPTDVVVEGEAAETAANFISGALS